jgi:hypothetical protein
MEELEDEELDDELEDEFLFVELPRESYKPGDQVQGSVQWKFSDPAGQIDVRLLMEVDDKANRETSYAAGFRWDNLPEEGTCKFSLTPPEGPYTFLGQGFQIRWYVEAKCNNLSFTDEAQFTYSPTGAPLKLNPQE